MTVQELIDALMQVEDKTLEVSLFTALDGDGHAVPLDGLMTEDRFADNAPCCELFGSDGEECNEETTQRYGLSIPDSLDPKRTCR